MITLKNVSKTYPQGSKQFHAIQSVNLTISKGNIHGVIGASGAGKSTLLRIINLLETPDSGEVIIEGNDIAKLKQKKLREARRSIGMIFQHFHLVHNKTVFDNVAVSLQLARFPKKEINNRVIECLRFVGLEDQRAKYPAQLSGGQKQRVAIARALANKPSILLCDEPTSALDPNTTGDILRVLKMINEQLGVTIVIVSHEMNVIKSICNQVTVLNNGQVYETLEIEPRGLATANHDPSWFVEQLKKEAIQNA
ncbi:methionine ABC transporter ATP-binding protein [Bacillus kwashiorkori]|uniref:methionine ABC transporter ATP-binding protein n=1 Tax=Bacillus kwashiorkori TaxID=1522318 RepID=UPI0007808925|nr:ATP-binding cassette domain-containing protein [Bacillus kwashiorkori]